jgi:hypothetical protein
MEVTPTEDTCLALGGSTDSKFGADPDLRTSVFGYHIYFCEALIVWKSKAEQSVTFPILVKVDNVGAIYLRNNH